MDTPTPDTQRSPPDLPRWARVLMVSLALAACLAVFGLYLQPDFLVSLADRMWSCF